MTAYNNRQYRPITDNEIDVNDALTIRAIRDLSDSINNAKYWVMAHKIRNVICFPNWYSAATSDTNENVIAVWCPHFIGEAYSYFRFWVGCQTTTGSDSTLWKLYASPKQYTGAYIFDSSNMGSVYSMASFAVGSSSHAIATAGSMTITTDRNRLCWLVLTATNTSGTRSKLTTIDIAPRIATS